MIGQISDCLNVYNKGCLDAWMEIEIFRWMFAWLDKSLTVYNKEFLGEWMYILMIVWMNFRRSG
jgi:hypothetical protein